MCNLLCDIGFFFFFHKKLTFLFDFFFFFFLHDSSLMELFNFFLDRRRGSFTDLVQRNIPTQVVEQTVPANVNSEQIVMVQTQPQAVAQSHSQLFADDQGNLFTLTDAPAATLVQQQSQPQLIQQPQPQPQPQGLAYQAIVNNIQPQIVSYQ